MLQLLLQPGIVQYVVVHGGLLITVILAVALYITRRDERIDRYLKRSFEHAPSVPILGFAFYLMGPQDKILDKMFAYVKRHGTCIVGWIGSNPYVFLANPYDIEKILSSTVHINKGKDYVYLQTWLGTGLLTAQRQKWFHRRKLLTPTFHFKILEDFIPVFNEQAKILNAMLEQERRKGDTFNICPFISRCTLDIICETAMGEKINAQMGGEANYVKTINSLSEIILQKGLNPLYRNAFIWNMTIMGRLETTYVKTLKDFTEKVIKDRKAARRRNLAVASSTSKTQNDRDNPDGSKTRKAFLDLLLELQENENLTDDDVREEVDTFMFEGHDTTATSLDWAIMLIACYPECQKLLYEEVVSVLGDDRDRNITMADLKELKYLECVLKETLRLYPSVPFFMRSADVDIELDEKRIVPKGTTLLISTYMLHRFPEIFPNPDTFDPDRFTPENVIGRHPYSYIPFSAGPRNCIGQKFALIEEKIILAKLIKNFWFEPVDTMKTTIPMPLGVLRPKNGIKVKLINRK